MRFDGWWPICALAVLVNVLVFATAVWRGGVFLGGTGQSVLAAGLRSDMVVVQRPWVSQVARSEHLPLTPVPVDLARGRERLARVLAQGDEKVAEQIEPTEYCYLWGPLLDSQVQRVVDSLQGWSGRWQQAERENPIGYVVYLSKESVKNGVGLAELAAMGVRDAYFMVQSGPLQGAISLALFRDEPRAKRFLNDLEGKGLAGAAIWPRLGPKRTFIQAYGLKDQIDALKAIHRLNPRSSLRACP